MAAAVRTRALRWLRRPGYLRDEESCYEPNESSEHSAPSAASVSKIAPHYAQFAKSDGIGAQAQALVRHVAPKQVHELRVPRAVRQSARSASTPG